MFVNYILVALAALFSSTLADPVWDVTPPSGINDGKTDKGRGAPGKLRVAMRARVRAVKEGEDE